MAMNMAGSSGGGGRRGRRKAVMAEINVTPMVDVMLVLLIIFMVSAPLLTVGVPLDLPQTQAKSLEQDKTPLQLSVDVGGKIFINDTEVAMNELIPKLKAITDARGGMDERIYMRADKKVDKTLVASIALHVLVIGWGLVSFSTRAFEQMPEESLPVDIISADQLAKVTAGIKTGKKENPKPLVEKVAEAKPAEDAVGKITEKAPVVTDTAPPPQPKVEEKPVEKKPDPPKPVAEQKPKEEPKPVEKKPEPPRVDPIAEALKKDEKKPPPKPVAQAAKPPEPAKPKTERAFDQSKIAALLDKRDPSRQAVTGETLNSNAALGLAKGRASDNSATWGSMFQQQVERCWKKPYGGIETQKPEAAFAIRLKRDGRLEGMPVPEGTPATPYLRVYQESALRAIIECQPYNLPAAYFEEWKYFAPVFTERKT